MTIEQLEEANKKLKEIREIEDFLKAFHSPYVNVIRANDYRGDNETSKIMGIPSGSELEKVILNYFESRLKELKSGFEEL